MPTQPLVLKYPLDLSGHNPNNRILEEPHILPDGVNRAIVPKYGSFYTSTLVVREVVSGRVLTPRVDYHAIQLYQEATQLSGLEVCAAIAVINIEIDSAIEIDYQAVGGDYCFSVDAMQLIIDELDLDERPVQWADLIARPKEFPPAPHIHDAGDLYGFEYLIEAIDRLRDAYHVTSGCAVSNTGCAIDELKNWGHDLERRITETVYLQHTLDHARAHDLTRDQLGLSQLISTPLATTVFLTDRCLPQLDQLIKERTTPGLPF